MKSEEQKIKNEKLYKDIINKKPPRICSRRFLRCVRDSNS